MDNTQERIVRTKKEINKKKSRISTLIFTCNWYAYFN